MKNEKAINNKEAIKAELKLLKKSGNITDSIYKKSLEILEANTKELESIINPKSVASSIVILACL